MKKKYMKQILTVQGAREIHILLEKLSLIKEELIMEDIIHSIALIGVDGKQVFFTKYYEKDSYKLCPKCKNGIVHLNRNGDGYSCSNKGCNYTEKLNS